MTEFTAIRFTHTRTGRTKHYLAIVEDGVVLTVTTGARIDRDEIAAVAANPLPGDYRGKVGFQSKARETLLRNRDYNTYHSHWPILDVTPGEWSRRSIAPRPGMRLADHTA